jgi:hypothetical protein
VRISLPGVFQLIVPHLLVPDVANVLLIVMVILRMHV